MIDQDEILKNLKPSMMALYNIFKDPETSESIATMYWNIYQSLQAKGFNKEEAFRIMEKFDFKYK